MDILTARANINKNSSSEVLASVTAAFSDFTQEQKKELIGEIKELIEISPRFFVELSKAVVLDYLKAKL